MNSKLLLLPTALMVAGHSAAEAKGKKSDKRPNILVILAEDVYKRQLRDGLNAHDKCPR